MPNRLLLAAMIVTLFPFTVPAQAKTCSPKEAEAADAMVDHLDDWAKVETTFKKYGHCDDGSIAEGNSEAVVRLLVDRWQALPRLSPLLKRDPGLRKFVLRHVDGTADSEDLDKIRQLSASSCPQGMMEFCQDLGQAAVQAAQ